eukprot:CAMPEP_0168617522 /NCGR_PEP_ID=MMETSP0449_2-20121227/5585_1 /TAXON_ID=1082188 /ORGANISM="Strombidium rassoulzadegani, Strain ras09" /LENGTH=63 /DNA_ID=CAMNT_0008658339 /DNA_START=188 /DNA_END=379 /DNA_ORIENTATION=-
MQGQPPYKNGTHSEESDDDDDYGEDDDKDEDDKFFGYRMSGGVNLATTTATALGSAAIIYSLL